MKRQRSARSLSSPKAKFLSGRTCDSVELKRERHTIRLQQKESQKENLIERQIQYATIKSQLSFLSKKIEKASAILNSSTSTPCYNELKKRKPRIEQEIEAKVSNANLLMDELSVKARKYQAWRDQLLFSIGYGIFEAGTLKFPEGLICSRREKEFLIKVIQSLAPNVRLNTEFKEKQFERLANFYLINNQAFDEKPILKWILIHFIHHIDGKETTQRVTSKPGSVNSRESSKENLSILTDEARGYLEQLETQNISKLDISKELRAAISKFLQDEIKKIHRGEIYQFFAHVYGQERGCNFTIQHGSRRVMPTIIRTFFSTEILAIAYKYLL